MQEKLLRKYADLIIDAVLCEVDEVKSPFEYADVDTTLFKMREGVYLINKGKYKRLLRFLLEKEKWSEKFTEDYIDKKLRNIIDRTYKEKKHQSKGRAKILFSEFVSEVENYAIEQVVYIPLGNIQLEVNELEFGSLTFLNMTDSAYSEIRKKMGVLLSKEDRIDVFLQDLCGNVCAKYCCIAEMDRAKERALEECQRVLDVLQFAVFRLQQDHLRIVVGLLNEGLSYTRSIPVISQDGKSGAIYSSRMGPFTSLIINESVIEEMKRLEIFKVANILKSEIKTNHLQEMVLRGIRWFATAQRQNIKENRLLNLTTCLETFLTPKNKEKIAQGVARSVAVMLCTSQTDRLNMQHRMLELYNFRSRISHGGRQAILDTDLNTLTKITGKVLTIIIQRMDSEWLKLDDLIDWIAAEESKSAAISEEKRVFSSFISFFKSRLNFLKDIKKAK